MILRGLSPFKLSVSRWLLVLAVLAAGVGLTTGAVPVPEPEPKKEPAVPVPPIQRVPELPPIPDFILPPNIGFDPAQFQRMQADMKRVQEEMFKRHQEAIERMQRQFPNAGFPAVGLRGLGMNSRLGVQVGKPNETVVEQLDLPRNQGLVVERVEAGSAAEKAGLKTHDILLELAGKPVSNNPEDLAAQLRDLKADEVVEAVVLRKGKKETVKGLALPEARVPAPFGVPFGAGAGVGTNLSVVRNNDRFTTTLTEGGSEYRLTGSVNAGVANLEEAAITENGATTKYDSLEKIPEGNKAKVKELLEMSATGRVKIGQ